MEDPGNQGFMWFIGVIDDNLDPKQLGRVKVRILDDYDESIESEDIPWAIVMAPPTSASFLGVGVSPVGMVRGTRVIGFFLDGEKKTKPVVMGTMPFIRNGDDLDHSVSTYARGKGAVQKDYLDYEPQSEYAAEYPYNHTLTTVSGHVVEFDDTPKSERVHIYHKSGAYIEIFPDGRIVTKSPKDNIEISIGDKNVVSDEGAINLSAKKNVNLVSTDGEGSIVAKGDVGILSQDGSALLGASNNVEIEAKKTLINSDTEISGTTTVKGNTKLDSNLNVGGKTTLGGSVTIRGAVSVIGSLKVNGRNVDLK